MTSDDFVLISPLVAGILTATAILIVDLIRPGKTWVAVGVALFGLGITAVLTVAVWQQRPGRRSVAPTRSTR